MPISYFENFKDEADGFIAAWGPYTRVVDDTVDKGSWGREQVMRAFALGCLCYSNPFYRKHVDKLQVACLVTTSLWAKSAEWERQPELWKRQWADVLRHADVVIFGVVTLICSGWHKMHESTGMYLAAGYADHKTRYGVPT